jgi:Mg/Co/Ni transporter MgtE
MPILHRIRDRALWLVSYLLDPFGTAQVRSSAAEAEVDDDEDPAADE